MSEEDSLDDNCGCCDPKRNFLKDLVISPNLKSWQFSSGFEGDWFFLFMCFLSVQAWHGMQYIVTIEWRPCLLYRPCRGAQERERIAVLWWQHKVRYLIFALDHQCNPNDSLDFGMGHQRQWNMIFLVLMIIFTNHLPLHATYTCLKLCCIVSLPSLAGQQCMCFHFSTKQLCLILNKNFMLLSMICKRFCGQWQQGCNSFLLQLSTCCW